jgi:hypothetical protein
MSPCTYPLATKTSPPPTPIAAQVRRSRVLLFRMGTLY